MTEETKKTENIGNKTNTAKSEDNNSWVRYWYFAEPTKNTYKLDGDRKPIINLKVDNGKIAIYLDENEKVEIIRLDINSKPKDSDLIAKQISTYVQSILRLTYAGYFKLSKVLMKAQDKSGGWLSESPKEFDVHQETHSPKFDKENFKVFSHFFSKKPEQTNLLAESIDAEANLIEKYSNLYKIIEYEYHLSGTRDAKTSLKLGGLRNIIRSFVHKGKSSDDLIDYIVDLRDKCNHLKKIPAGGKYGISFSDTEAMRELSDFIHIMQQICTKVISPNADFSLIDSAQK